jgi:hypothetical protein
MNSNNNPNDPYTRAINALEDPKCDRYELNNVLSNRAIYNNCSPEEAQARKEDLDNKSDKRHLDEYKEDFHGEEKYDGFYLGKIRQDSENINNANKKAIDEAYQAYLESPDPLSESSDEDHDDADDDDADDNKDAEASHSSDHATTNDSKDAQDSFGSNSPVDQFELRDLISIDAPILNDLFISLTNIGLYLTISTYLVLILNLVANNNKIISNN